MMIGEGDFDANLAAAAGEDDKLRQELLACFTDSVATQIDLLQRARCDGNWHIAASRLHRLGMSFHSPELTGLGEEAVHAAPGDPVVVRNLAKFAQSLANKA